MLNRRGPISKLVGGEYRADRKEKKAAVEEARSRAETARSSSATSSSEDHLVPHSVEYNHASPSSYTDDDLTDDEEWAIALDEAQQMHEISSSSPQQQGQGDYSANIDQFLKQFISRHARPSNPDTEESRQGHLSMPVILPQRRPESRHRGFVRAYAPVLEGCGIDQATWLEFLDGFEKSIDANPWFHVLNVAVAVGGHVNAALGGVSPIAFFAFTTLHVFVESGRRAYIHYQQNKYLDTMNEKFFKPRGLYCLVIKYKPSSNELIEDMDLNSNTTRTIEKRDGQSKWKNLVASSASTTTHETEIPEPAPLVFPNLDSMDESLKQNAVKQFGGFLAGYYDRQARAKFEAENPDTKIPQVPQTEFASRYSDPNHPASRGGLISIASGGKYNPVGPLGRIQERLGDRRGRLGVSRPPGVQQQRENRPLKRMLKQDTLYLMVVNMPSQEEMDLARVGLERVANC